MKNGKMNRKTPDPNITTVFGGTDMGNSSHKLAGKPDYLASCTDACLDQEPKLIEIEIETPLWGD